MNVSETAELVRAYFTEHASRWKVSPASLRVDYVPSPGGFGPMNFTVQDAHAAYHVKLNKERDELSAWVQASARLAEMYRAPRLLAQIEIAGRYGAIFQRLPGKSPTFVPTSWLERLTPLVAKAEHSGVGWVLLALAITAVCVELTWRASERRV